jgi:hypothetical protein
LSISAGSTTVYQDTRIGNTPKWPMSAYSASPPVIASTTAPRMKMPCQPWEMKNFAPHHGLRACTTSG